jgi:hypothetical protein
MLCWHEGNFAKNTCIFTIFSYTEGGYFKYLESIAWNIFSFSVLFAELTLDTYVFKINFFLKTYDKGASHGRVPISTYPMAILWIPIQWENDSKGQVLKKSSDIQNRENLFKVNTWNVDLKRYILN